MKILAIECSASPASVAIVEDDKIIASSFVNVKLTHSQTLLPLVESILNASLTDISDIQGYAVSAGPGSFTGIRIGISAIKGIAAPTKAPCAAVSTLRAMAENYKDTNCIVCAVMDARCNQVYSALFSIDNGKISRLCPDRALMCKDLAEEIKKMSQKCACRVIIVGDGTDIFYPYVNDIDSVEKSDNKKRFQNAVGVGFASTQIFKTNNSVTPDKLLPTYLRLPQAERELKRKR